MNLEFKKIVIIIALVVFGVAGAALILYNSMKSSIADHKDEISIESMIKTYTRGKNDVKLTIGLLQADQMKYKVFGMNGKELEPAEYQYEIGSISKTFTASMLCKAIDNGLVVLNDPISEYLPLESPELDSQTAYPTVLSLATHTSGFGEYPFDPSSLSEEELEQIDKDFYKKKKNIYKGTKSSEILDKIEAHPLKDKTYGWEYSNFGIAVLGTVLGEVNHTSFQLLAQDFIKNDLGLSKTRLGNGKGNLSNYWTWDDGDAYMATAGVVSTVTDMLKYGRMHLNATPEYLALSHKIYRTFEEEGLSMGLGWIIDPETGYLWHNGGTSSYTCFLGIDKEHGTVVVILSNYPEIDDSKDDGALDILGYTLLDRLGKGEKIIL